MTNIFTAKNIHVPGLLPDDAFQEQLKLYTQQQKDTQGMSPAPSSAVEFSDRIADDILRNPAPKVKATPAPVAIPFGVGGGGKPDPVASAITIGTPSAAGTLTPEESAEYTADRVEDAKAQETAVTAHAKRRNEMRALTDQQAAEMGLPVPPGGTDEEVKRGEAQLDAKRVEAAGAAVGEAATPVTQTWWLNAMQVGAREAAQTATGALKYPTILFEGIADLSTGNQREDPSELRAWLQSIDKSIDAALPGDKARAKDFLTQVAAGSGSMLAFMVAGYVGAAARLPVMLTTGSLGAATEGSQLFEEAESFGASGFQKYIALLVGTGLGLTEAIPIDRMFMRADQSSGGFVRRLLENTVAGSMGEFIQEAGQALGEDLTAKYLAGFDPDREIDAGKILKQGLIGAIVGGATAGGITATGGLQDGGLGYDASQQEEIASTAIEQAQVQIDRILGPDRNDAPLPTFGPGPDITATADTETVTPTPSVEAGGIRLPTPAGDIVAQIGQAADGSPALTLGAAPAQAQTYRGGTPPQLRDDGRVEMHHWSSAPFTVIDPAKRGTGPLNGAERQRLGEAGAGDQNIVDRSYYGIGDPDYATKFQQENRAKKPRDRGFMPKDSPYQREGLGPFRHTVSADPNEIYNMLEDPLGLRAQLDPDLSQPERINQYERLIRDAGFKGYWMSQSPLGQTAAMFDQRAPETIFDERTQQPTDVAAILGNTRVPPEDLEPLPGLSLKNSTGPIESVVRAAHAYAESRGIILRRQSTYVQADPERGARIAQAYEEMKDDPSDPAVAAAYDALIVETLAQYQFVKESGVKIEFIEPGQPDPYPEGPKQVLADLKAGHLWVFPTEGGFGTINEASDANPLLRPTDEKIGSRTLLANDVFRIVHDFFGHGLEGAGFGARGEENAWQSHMRLYSPAAIPAMTSETRGQNSWVNFGPHGEANRSNQRETVYADQKVGLMPDWTWQEGVDSDTLAIIAGRRVPEVDRLADQAEVMEALDASPKEIWDALRMYRGHDKKWRFELVDKDARLRLGAKQALDNEGEYTGRLRSILVHPQLFDAYPQLMEITVSAKLRPGEQEGLYYAGRKYIEARAKSGDELVSVLLHEIQHAVQDVEGFAQGGNLSMGERWTGYWVDRARDQLQRIKHAVEHKGAPVEQLVKAQEQLTYAARYQYYFSLAGEVEARNVQFRYEENLEALKRAAEGDTRPFYNAAEGNPLNTEDVRPEQQVVISYSKNGEGFAASVEQPAAAPSTQTPEFKKWFGDSKVVDESGAPLVVYHGTNADFDAFDPSKVGSAYGSDEQGFYFTSLRSEAEKWAARAPRAANPKVLPVYLSIQKPWEIEVPAGQSPVAYFESGEGVFDRGQQAAVAYGVSSGYDGMILRGEEETLFIAFAPTQIKSVNNRGTFDPDDPSIMASLPQGTSATRESYRAEQTRPAGGIDASAAVEANDVNLAKISRNFIRLLDLTVRQGRLTAAGGGRVMGQYSRRQAVARLRSWDDLSTLVHEGGHALHDMMDGELKAFTKANEDRLMKVADRLYGQGLVDTAKLSRADHVREGFAELFRIYTLNPGYARRTFPEVTEALDATLRREAPQITAGLESIGQQFAAYLQLPSMQLFSNMVVDGRRETSAVNEAMQELRDVGFRSWMSEYGRKAVSYSVNRFAGLNKIVSEILNIGEENRGGAIDLKRAEDPRTLIRLATNSGSRAAVQLSDGIMSYRGTEPTTRSLREALLISQGLPPTATPAGFDEQRLQDFDGYLIARRALDEFRRLDEGKIARPPVNATKGDTMQAIADYEAKYGEAFTKAADIVHEFGMAMWRKQFDAGLMSKDVYEKGLDRQFYVPLQRDMSDRARDFAPTAVTNGRSLVKKFKGSNRNIVSPTSILMHKLYALEQTIAQNDVVKALAVLADRAGTAGALVERIPATKVIGQTVSVLDAAKALTKDDTLTEMDAQDLMTLLSAAIKDGNSISLFRREQASTLGENIIFFWENGTVQALQLQDGEIGADVMNVLNSVGRENMPLFVELIAGTSTAFRTLITKWPDFLIVNYIRDQMSAWVLSDVGFKPFASGIGGMADEIRQKTWARKANAAMMTMGGMNVATLHQTRIDRDIRALRGNGYIAKVFNDRSARGLAAGLGRITELSETGTRLGLFKNAYRRAKKDGLDDWEASIEAAYTATDYIDFGLNGSRMLMWRRVIPFLNAQLQGYYKMMRTLGGDEVRQRKGLKFALGAFFKSTKNLPLSRTEKQAINTGRKAWVKMAALGLIGALLHFLFRDDEDYQEAGEYLRTTGWVIPIGGGRIFYIPKPFELALMSNAVERGLEYASGDKEAVNRFMRGAAMTMVPPTSPPAIQLLVEYVANKDFFTGQEIVPGYMQALSPELQYNNYTSEFAKQIGGITGWSPMVLDHFISGLGASAYRDAAAITNALDPDRPTMQATDAPILRRFIRDIRRGSASSRDFWAQASTLDGKLRRAEVTYKSYLEGGNTGAAERFLSSLSDDEKSYALLATNFDAKYKRLNPFYRARQVTTIVSAMRRELVSDLGLENTDKFAGSPAIPMSKAEKAEVDTLLSELARREMRNTLVATSMPGWNDKKRVDTQTTKDMMASVMPAAAEELQRRLDKAKVYDAETVFEYWPEVRTRLIEDREEAFLDDLVSIAKVQQ